MAEKGLPAPTPKPVRAKSPAQTKAKALPNQNTSNTSIPFGTKSGNTTCNTHRSAERSGPTQSTKSTKSFTR